MARAVVNDIQEAGAIRLYRESKTITFAGGTVNGIGDFDGTGNPVTLFTVTGAVAARVFAVVSTDLAGASATVEVGIAGNTAALIAQATATDLDQNEVYTDSGPSTLEPLVDPKIIGNGQDIILTVGTANITSGVMTVYVEFYPITNDGDVRAA